jgi:hypothetical protein
MARRYPYIRADVPWSDFEWEYVRGWHEGLPLLAWGQAPRDKLATYRQLRKRGLRPGGQQPVAVVYFTNRKSLKKTFAFLYMIVDAKPIRPMTPAKRAAIEKALAKRRTCRQCGTEAAAELPKAHRTCEPCRYQQGLAEPDERLHEYVVGEPTYSPEELAQLPTLAELTEQLWSEACPVGAARVLEVA